jgi:hypothetical protein
MSLPIRRLSGLVTVALWIGILAGCDQGPVNILERESLFRLQIGRLENQLDLITRNGVLPDLRTSVAMVDGFVYIGNGPANKAMEFTSYGDLIRLIYDPTENPQPVSLGDGEEESSDGSGRTRFSREYDFSRLGAIAVDSRRRMYVEDRLPPERSVYDESLEVQLNRIVVRFDETGAAVDYLGQEGIGGTPFPFIESISMTVRDELAVISKTMNARFFYLFSPEGDLMYSMRIGLDRIPVLDSASNDIAILDSVVAGTDKYRVYLKVSYYRAIRDEETDKESGINLVESRVYWIDLQSGRYEGFFELPDTSGTDSPFPYELLGVSAGEYVYLAGRIDVGRTRLLIMNDEGRVVRRRNIAIPEADLVMRAFHVNPAGVLTGLLGYTEHAEVVWWRADRLLPGGSAIGEE